MPKSQVSRRNGLFLFLVLIIFSGYFVSDYLPGKTLAASPQLTAAKADVSAIAARSHMMGSAANHKVRDYILSEFAAMGVSAKSNLNGMVYVDPHQRKLNSVRAATVDNIIGRIKGTGDGPAIGLLAHYDSRDSGGGAGDDAAGVAAVLAAARAMAKGPAPLRDVYFILTDGEEMGMLGAQQFFRVNPLHKKIGLVINFEARGSAGPAALFETGASNAALISEASQATALNGTSLAYAIYQKMPNDTDLSVVKTAGIQGLNFAFADNFFDYHSPTDTAANLSDRSLNDHLEYAVNLSQHFANLAELPSASTDATFFNPVPGVFIHYGINMTYALGVLALVFGLLWLVRSYRTLTPGAVLGAVLSHLWMLAVIGFVVFNLHNVLVQNVGYDNSRFWRIFYQYHYEALAYTALVLGLLLSFCGRMATGNNVTAKSRLVYLPGLAVLLLGPLFLLNNLPVTLWFVSLALLALGWLLLKPKSPQALSAGFVLLWCVMLVAMLVLIPLGSYVLTWPLLLLALIRLFMTRGKTQTTASLTIEIIIITLIFVPLAYSFYILAGVTMPLIPAVFLAIGLLLSSQSLERIAQAMGQLGHVVLMVLGLGLLAFIYQHNSFNPRHGEPSEVYFLQNDLTGEQYWASSDAKTNAWTESIFGDDAKDIPADFIWPLSKETIKVKPIKAQRVTPAIVLIEDEYIEDGKKHLKILFNSMIHAEYFNLFFSPVTWSAASINGLPVDISSQLNLKAGQWWRWRYYAMPEDGITLDLVFDADEVLEMRVLEVKYSWPDAIQPPPRPANVMARPYAWSDATVVVQEKIFK